MSNPSFRFKQFTVWHDKCAMKVGTDGVLLGAWSDVRQATRILDVGAGTGLLSLQLAQRNPRALITAIEIDADAAAQAAGNVRLSPWPDRIEVVHADFAAFQADAAYDLIVSNPPYFMDALKCPDGQRNLARHTDTLDYGLLLRRASSLLSPYGHLDIIIPADAGQVVLRLADSYRFHLVRLSRVYTKPDKPCRRLLCSFSLASLPCVEETLCIENAAGGFTEDYIALTRDFYLKM
ncbi:MAG: methyltransferase [Prevotellaceae bacterium]|nr:methyltransferase [Prevotellaceae bacterium]